MKDLLLDRWESTKYEAVVQNITISLKTKAISFFSLSSNNDVPHVTWPSLTSETKPVNSNGSKLS